MTTLVYDEQGGENLERLVAFLAESDPASAAATVKLIDDAVRVLANHPWIGRRVVGELRELVISRGHTGYLALYEFQPSVDRVTVRAIRHQCEAGFDD